MKCKKIINMKRLLLIALLLIGNLVFAQEWINDDTFDETITPNNAFGDDNSEIIIIEFYAGFNKDNAFKEWKKLDDLDGVNYYRIDLATSPRLKKELRIRMAPTILIYSKGDAYIKFTAKAGLDLKCPVDYPKMLRAIAVVKEESQY
tara:strand:+ start:460 stop:900 length:441 start_codon:yes stop_codon:yes gene_type:complete